MTMKKIMNLFVLAIALAVVFVGCKKDDPVKDAPKPTLTSGAKAGATVITGQEITYVIDVTSTVDLKTMTITAPAGTIVTVSEKTSKVSGTGLSYTFIEKSKEATITAKVILAKVGLDSIKFSFANVNVGFDKAVSDKFTAISSIKSQANITINSSNLVLTGSQVINKGAFITLTDMKNDPTKGDLVYVFHGAATNMHCFGSPDNSGIKGLFLAGDGVTSIYPTGTFNKTSVGPYTGAYPTDAASLDKVAVTDQGIVRNVAKGSMIAFVTKDGRKGVIKLNSGTWLKVDGTCNIDYVVQEVGTSAGK